VGRDLHSKLVEEAGVYLREENDLGIQEVRLSELYTTQLRVMEGRLVSMVNDNVTLGATSTQEITVVLVDGKYVIIDGNHRLTLAKLYGNKSLKVHLRRLP
jgi:FKBP-type peptidyl-prolyl cis-trans isomerase 2